MTLPCDEFATLIERPDWATSLEVLRRASAMIEKYGVEEWHEGRACRMIYSNGYQYWVEHNRMNRRVYES